MENTEEESLLDKGDIIKKIRTLLPKEYRLRDVENDSLEKMHSMSLMKVISMQFLKCKDTKELEEPAEENEEIESGKFLWDISALPEYAIFLEKHHIVPILTNIISLPSQHTSRLLVKLH